MSSSVGCENCAKLMDCISNLEANINIMQNSFQLVNNILQEFKKEYANCVGTNNPQCTDTDQEQTITERVLRKRKVVVKLSPKNKRKPKKDLQLKNPVSPSETPKAAPVIQTVAEDGDPPSKQDANENITSDEQTVSFAGSSTLRAAATKKAVFVTGLDAETTVEEILNHIKNELDFENIFGFYVHKLKIDPGRGYSGFKIFTGRSTEAYDKLVDSSFWPDGVHADCFRSKPKGSGNSK